MRPRSPDSYDELPASMKGKVMRLFAFGIPKHRLKQAVRNLRCPPRWWTAWTMPMC